jgi:hypothetical protein
MIQRLAKESGLSGARKSVTSLCQCHQRSLYTTSPDDDKLQKSKSIDGCLKYFFGKKLCQETIREFQRQGMLVTLTQAGY